ncbi:MULTISPECIES: hypothetical protein [unclassified Sphingomonas]|uniref:hypothetical protein n=1 Tax=unclassified Sphingomonas TaxID=196159 RepID=UPI00226A619C|nr:MULTISPECIES: hypothetical protein [unclassified Sphingomonas]
MTELPAPLTPTDCDLRDFGFMPIEPGRLFGSEFHALADDGAWRAGVTLWLKAWHQVPAGSLPNDDTALARLAELGRDRAAWLALKPAALRGWIECADGRLYHPVVAEKALEAWLEKLVQRASGAAGNAKRWGVDTDLASANAAIDDAAALLFHLAPQSRSLVKLARRQWRHNSGGASQPDPDPIATRSRPDRNPTPTAIATRSQGTVKGQGQGHSPAPTKAADSGVAAVMRAAGMTRKPIDHHIVSEWLALSNMKLERDVLPIVERVGREVMERTGKPPFKLGYFDGAIREEHAAGEARLAQLRRGRERIERMDQEAADRAATEPHKTTRNRQC